LIPSLLETLADAGHMVLARDVVGLKGQFALGHDLGAKVHVGPEAAGLGDVADHEPEFEDAPVGPDGFQEGIPEGLDLGYGGIAFAPGHVTQDVHDPGDVDVVGAACRTRLASGAQPDGLAGEDGFFLAVLQQAHDLADGDVVGEGVRAARRAVAALIAQADFLLGLLFHASHEIRVEVVRKINDVHKPSSARRKRKKVDEPFARRREPVSRGRKRSPPRWATPCKQKAYSSMVCAYES